MSLESWFNWWGNRGEEVVKPEPIVWVDEEPANRRPNPPPAPPAIKRWQDDRKSKPARDLLLVVKMLSRDTIDFLTFNGCNHTKKGLRERHQTLIELIEENEK